MKTKWTAVAALAMFVASLTAGGCVSAAKYQDAVAANDRAQERLSACQAGLSVTVCLLIN